MARGFRNLRKVSRVHEEEKESFWVSYTDLMSGLLIIFALVIAIAMFQTQSAFEQKNKAIEDAVGVKTKIIQELVKAFKDSDLGMEVDPQTGAIRFSGGVLFASNSSEISPMGKEYLSKFIPKYVAILLSDQFKNEISQIIVEGHTDTAGGYLYNLNLSQARALSVVQQIYSPGFLDPKYVPNLQKVLTANGRSYSVPINGPNGQIDPDKSRRVEFKFRLKDDQLLDKISEMVKTNGTE